MEVILSLEDKVVKLSMVVSTYRAKPGEEDAIIALHEDWQRKQDLKDKVYLSWELLRNTEAPREFIAIAYFESEELARAMVDDLNQDAWFFRLVSLIEEGPACMNYQSAWRAL